MARRFLREDEGEAEANAEVSSAIENLRDPKRELRDD